MAVFAVLSRHFLSGDAPAQGERRARGKQYLSHGFTFLSVRVAEDSSSAAGPPARRERGGIGLPNDVTAAAAPSLLLPATCWPSHKSAAVGSDTRRWRCRAA